MRLLKLILNTCLPVSLIHVLGLVFAPAQSLEVAQEQQRCSQIKANKTLSYIFHKSESAAGFLKLRSDACSILTSYLHIPQDELVLTTASTSYGQAICISANPAAVCKSLIADVEPGVIAGEALQFVFSDTVQTAGPQKQTVERLFIRPASIIR